MFATIVMDRYLSRDWSSFPIANAVLREKSEVSFDPSLLLALKQNAYGLTSVDDLLPR